jgi:Holliday junction DNA helicase RuvA
MIGSLRGRLIHKKPDHVLVDVGGVGYLVHVPLNTLSNLPGEGDDVLLKIHTHVRDDAIQLFGFLTEEEKKMFVTLLGITGVGPKMALNVLSGIPYDDFLAAVGQEDVAMLCRVPGLGKKTAHRLILELRDKLPSPAAVKEEDRVFDDVLSALVNLGYKRNTAQEYLDKTYKQGHRDIEGLLKETLKLLTAKAG